MMLSGATTSWPGETTKRESLKKKKKVTTNSFQYLSSFFFYLHPVFRAFSGLTTGPIALLFQSPSAHHHIVLHISSCVYIGPSRIPRSQSAGALLGRTASVGHHFRWFINILDTSVCNCVVARCCKTGFFLPLEKCNTPCKHPYTHWRGYRVEFVRVNPRDFGLHVCVYDAEGFGNCNLHKCTYS